MSKISHKEKKAEAVRRMKLLGIFPETIKQFERGDKISASEPPVGAYFWVEGDELERIRAWEQRTGNLVYSVIHAYCRDFGRVDSWLFVSDYKDEEWAADRASCERPVTLESGRKALCLFTYCYNHGEPDYSEYGDALFQLAPGAGLVRIG